MGKSAEHVLRVDIQAFLQTGHGLQDVILVTLLAGLYKVEFSTLAIEDWCPSQRHDPQLVPDGVEGVKYAQELTLHQVLLVMVLGLSQDLNTIRNNLVDSISRLIQVEILHLYINIIDLLDPCGLSSSWRSHLNLFHHARMGGRGRTVHLL
jgi:hypothetical protein